MKAACRAAFEFAERFGQGLAAFHRDMGDRMKIFFFDDERIRAHSERTAIADGSRSRELHVRDGRRREGRTCLWKWPGLAEHQFE